MDNHLNQIIDLLTHNFAQLEAQAFQESELTDLSMKQVVYLEIISRLENPTFSDLARELGVSKPSVTAIFIRLSQKGYLTKVQSADDRRTFFIHLTEKGKALQQVHENLHRKIAEHFASALTQDELAHLGKLLQKIVETGS